MDFEMPTKGGFFLQKTRKIYCGYIVDWLSGKGNFSFSENAPFLRKIWKVKYKANISKPGTGLNISSNSTPAVEDFSEMLPILCSSEVVNGLKELISWSIALIYCLVHDFKSSTCSNVHIHQRFVFAFNNAVPLPVSYFGPASNNWLSAQPSTLQLSPVVDNPAFKRNLKIDFLPES